jgi:fumarate hydratase class II
MMIYNLLQSVRLMAEGSEAFTAKCVVGIEADVAVIKANLDNTLMLVTALNPHIGSATTPSPLLFL